jgi:hypothetical protein
MARTRVRAGDVEIIREAKARFERCVAWESTARANALADAKFANGDSVNLWQWDTDVRKMRGNRPMLTMNKTRQHILQIVNDARQHKAQIKVTPVGGHASYEAAQVFSGIVRRIEYQSKAVDAYSTAIYHQVETGIGYVRVVTDYADEESFDLDIYIHRIADQNTVYMDPDAKQYDKSDSNFTFVFVDKPRDMSPYKDQMPEPAPLDHSDGWNDKDHIRECEYFRRTHDNDKLYRLPDGTSRLESDMEDDERESMRAAVAGQGDLDDADPDKIRVRAVSTPVIDWFKIVGDRIVSREPWPGRYIPIVPFIGEETVIDGQMDRRGHTRCLIDAQRMYNYWSSSATEQVALQTKTPYVGTARAIEGYEKFWDQANSVNLPYMIYNDVDDTGQTIPNGRPSREQPPVMAEAYVKGMEIAREDMMMVSGQYQALVGAPSNEISGTAIQQRQRQGENSTYHYIDNQAKGIRQIGRIVIDLIPKIYDVARVIKIMAEDGSESDVHLVPNAPQAHQQIAMTPNGPQPVTPQQAAAVTADPKQPNPKVIFNPNVGRYDVEADVGPSYGTQRQEASNAFGQIMAQNPAAFQVVGDFWAQNSDFPGADELAERLRRGLPPQYKADTPDPEVMKLQQALQQTTVHANQTLQQADAEIARLKAECTRMQEQLKDKSDETAIKDYDAETRRLAAVGNIDPASLQVIVRQMVSDMLQTEIAPHLQAHAALNASLQPPEPQPETVQ